MKNARKYLAIVALAGAAALIWPSLNVRSQEAEGALDTEEFKIGPIEEGAGGLHTDEGVAAREAFRRLQLQDENGEIPPDAWLNAYAEKAAMPYLPEAWAEFGQVPRPWVSIGPGNIGGRIRSMVVHPGYPNPATIWVGGVSGGVWKTTNDGVTWSTTTNLIPNMGVACLAIDPQNPLTLYAGTGEVFPGAGIFKTTDGGDHWGTPLNGTESFASIGRLAICPTNSQLILAAATNGLYRSQDGGANWLRVLNVPSMNDVDFRPAVGSADPNDVGPKCIAGDTGGNAYYSTNGGATWTAAIWSGGPHSPGRVELGYSRSEPSIVYASVGLLGGQIFRSSDGGHSFQFKGNPYVATGRYGPNGWANALWVDPIDPNTVLAGGQYLSRSTDQGITWEEASSNSTHQDHHVIVEDPRYNRTTNKTVFGGNDGGIFRTDNILLPCPNGDCVVWTALNHTLGITQFYGGAGHAATGAIIGGTQDNGTVRFLGDPEDWGYMRYGDGGFCAVDQSSEPYFYGEGYQLTMYRSITATAKAQDIWGGPGHPNGIPHPPECGGDLPCANFTAPFILDPNNRDRILGGGASLWRTNNARESDSFQVAWTGIKDPVGASTNYINAVAVAEGNSNLIWVGYNDGSVYYTTNGTAGPSPSPTPSWTPVSGLPARMCTRITIGPAVPDVDFRKVYATFGGFGSDNVYKTENNGASWVKITTGLPKAPVYSLVISPSNPDTLYLGTEVGVFASVDGGTTWSPGAPGAGDPTHAAVKELFWMGPKLVAATHGRGMFTLVPQSP